MWAVLVDRLEQEIRSAQQAAYMARMMGSDVDVPAVDDAVRHLERIVCEEPRQVDEADRQLRAALGLRSGGG